MGLAQGLADGWITPWANMSSTMCDTFSRYTKGIRLIGCLMGGWSPVWISCCTTLVHPNSLSSRANTSAFCFITDFNSWNCCSVRSPCSSPKAVSRRSPRSSLWAVSASTCKTVPIATSSVELSASLWRISPGWVTRPKEVPLSIQVHRGSRFSTGTRIQPSGCIVMIASGEDSLWEPRIFWSGSNSKSSPFWNGISSLASTNFTLLPGITEASTNLTCDVNSCPKECFRVSGCPLAWCIEMPKWDSTLVPRRHGCLLLGCTNTGTLTVLSSADTIRVVLAVITSSSPLLPENLCMGLVRAGKGLPWLCKVRPTWCNNSREMILDCDPQSTIASTGTPSTSTLKYIIGPIASEVSAVVVTISTLTLSSCNNWISSCSRRSASMSSNCCTVNDVDRGVASTAMLFAVLEPGFPLFLLPLLELALDLPGASAPVFRSGQFVTKWVVEPQLQHPRRPVLRVLEPWSDLSGGGFATFSLRGGGLVVFVWLGITLLGLRLRPSFSLRRAIEALICLSCLSKVRARS